jgi:iron(III) transport system substrate-binding protein
MEPRFMKRSVMERRVMKGGNRRRLRPLTVVAAGALLLLAACGGGGDGADAAAAAATPGEPGPPMSALYDSAKAAGEDTVVVYGIKGEDCYDEFSKQFPGITVQTQYMVGETQARLEQEHVSGQNVGDVLRTGDTTMLALIKEGILSSFTPSTADKIPDTAWGPDHAMVNDTKRVSGLAYNTAQLTPEQAPKSWADLADPRFKGKVVMPDPTGPGAGLSILQELLKTGGATDEAWLKALAANQPAFVKGVQPAIETLKTGEYPVMFGGLDQITGKALEQGTTLKFVFPVAGATPVTSHYTGLITNAPHPNAAKLLISWLLSEEGQTCLSQTAHEYPVREGVAPPPGLPALADLQGVSAARPANYDVLDQQQAMLKQFQQVFAR